MSNLLPLRPSTDHTPRSRAVLDVADDDTAETLDTMTSVTARDIVVTLADGPATTSDLADTIDATLQNVHYHLERLRAADLVTEVGTWYSEKGSEMTVYGLTSERIELRIQRSDTPDDVAPDSRSPAGDTAADSDQGTTRS